MASIMNSDQPVGHGLSMIQSTMNAVDVADGSASVPALDQVVPVDRQVVKPTPTDVEAKSRVEFVDETVEARARKKRVMLSIPKPIMFVVCCRLSHVNERDRADDRVRCNSTSEDDSCEICTVL